MNELALFAGAGGGILGGHLLGWRTVCAVEWEPYPASVLCARQNDGLLPTFPIWDDVQTFDGHPWRGIVDVISGGFPCQDISAAGKGAGIDGERSGMWGEMARVIREVRPRFVFVENSPMLTSRGLGRVLGDLAAMGFDARWGVLGAADVGANHQRDRIWIVGKVTNAIKFRSQTERAEQQTTGVARICKKNGKIANPNSIGLQKPAHQQELESQGCNQLQIEQSRDSSNVANTKEFFSNGGNDNARISLERKTQIKFRNNCGSTAMANTCEIRSFSEEAKQGMVGQVRFAECGVDRNWWQREPEYVPRTTQRNVGRVADGVAARVDRLKAIGNGQVPLCAATAWRILSELL